MPPCPTGEATNITNLEALERFVVDNEALLELEERIGRFNIFDALSIVNAEIRHSNFLAWLLDPNESHGQGPLFLKAVLMDLLRQSPPELRPFSPVKLDGAELRGVDVRREWQNIDILITCKDPAFVIAIENKIKAGKYNPFEEYEKRVKTQYPSTPTMFVLLTIDGSELEDYEWVPYRYEDIHNALTRVRKTHAPSIGDDVLVFLDHYTRLIGSRFMDDPKIDELCQTIYKNHRQAIELLIEHTNRSGSVMAEVASALSEIDGLEILNVTSVQLHAIPRSWRGVLPPIGVESSYDKQEWIRLYFEHVRSENKLYFTSMACPTSDASLRERIVSGLVREGRPLGLNAAMKRVKPQWTRLSKSETIIRWKADEQPSADQIRETVLKKVNSFLQRAESVTDLMRQVLRDMSV